MIVPEASQPRRGSQGLTVSVVGVPLIGGVLRS